MPYFFILIFIIFIHIYTSEFLMDSQKNWGDKLQMG
jgi:hypothetical protein